MAGSEEAPPVIGAAFDRKWRAHVPALIDKIWRSMPQDDPGTLTQAQAEALTDLILKANRAPRAP